MITRVGAMATDDYSWFFDDGIPGFSGRYEIGYGSDEEFWQEDLTRIWYHSNYHKDWFILSQIRGRVIVFTDRIHRELGNLEILIWFVKQDVLRVLKVNYSFILNKYMLNSKF